MADMTERPNPENSRKVAGSNGRGKSLPGEAPSFQRGTSGAGPSGGSVGGDPWVTGTTPSPTRPVS